MKKPGVISFFLGEMLKKSLKFKLKKLAKILGQNRDNLSSYPFTQGPKIRLLMISLPK